MKTEHKLNPLQHQRGRVTASCTCGEWFRYTDDDAAGPGKLRVKHAEHIREMRRKK